MIWDPFYECMAPEQRAELQVRRLRETVARLKVNVPWYRDRFAENDIEPEDIQSLDDLQYLPFTMKEDLRDNYPFGLFAIPPDECVRIHASSGTTGKPVIAGYAPEDINIWAETIARTIACGGGTSHDVLHNAYGYGLFTGGLGLHYGGERMGCLVVPVSGGNTERQLMLMEDLGSSILCCTPSYSLTIVDQAEELGFDLSRVNLKSGLFGAEPWSEGAREAIEERLGLSAGASATRAALNALQAIRASLDADRRAAGRAVLRAYYVLRLAAAQEGVRAAVDATTAPATG
jgi:phenylacetate-CoA ligase